MLHRRVGADTTNQSSAGNMPGDGERPAVRENSPAAFPTPDIACLFAGVAADHLHRPHGSSHPNLASLSLSLNPTGPPTELPLMEAALSLMCFPSSQLALSTLTFLVESIVVALPSSAAIAGADDCAGLFQACVDVLPSLRGYDDLYGKLLRAVLLSANSYSSHGIPSSIVSKLHAYLPKATAGVICETPSRTLLWYLDPLSFKHDISEIMREAAEKPLLCVKEELHERLGWREIVLCLLLQPTFFIEARALLHSWFLTTGSSSVQDLLVVFVSTMLDALSRPMWWGLSMEVGMKLPQSRAYFPSTSNELLMKLAGPISFQNFAELVRIISVQLCDNSFPQGSVGSCTSSRPCPQASLELAVKNYNCTWALLMEFPRWFYYASMLLFCREDSQENGFKMDSSQLVKDREHLDVQITNAAQYLSWMLWPVKDEYNDALVDCLTEISRSWPPSDAGRFASLLRGTLGKKSGRSLKLNKTQASGGSTKKSGIDLEMMMWLKHIHGLYVEHPCKAGVGCERRTPRTGLVHPDSLFRRIPIGILIGCSKYLDEKGCGFLLHYAATGDIVGSEETERGWDGEAMDNILQSDKMKGLASEISFLFSLYDVIEDMFIMMLGDEIRVQDYMCFIKSKGCSYLVSCIKKLLKHKIHDLVERAGLFTCLSKRLDGWRCQEGQSGLCEFLDEVVKELTSHVRISD